MERHFRAVEGFFSNKRARQEFGEGHSAGENFPELVEQRFAQEVETIDVRDLEVTSSPKKLAMVKYRARRTK